MYKSLNKRFMKYLDSDIITNGERYFVIRDDRWNGEGFYDCFEVDKNFSIVNYGKYYTITPVYEQNGDDFKIIDYKIEEE